MEVKFDDEVALVASAREVAFRAHADHHRWDGTPYIYHPLRVADAFVAHPPWYTCVALMHDVIEDSDYTADVLSTMFPAPVVEALVLLTHSKEIPYSAYISSLKASRNSLAISVKIADMVDNLRALPEGHRNVSKYRNALIQLATV